MLNNVVYNIRIFVNIYLIMLFLFSLMFGVLGLGNHKIPGSYRKKYLKVDGTLDDDHPYHVYSFVGDMIGNLVECLKISLGEYSIIGVSDYLDKRENTTFWFLWFLILITTLIVFLNFLVAETTNSYKVVKKDLVAYV